MGVTCSSGKERGPTQKFKNTAVRGKGGAVQEPSNDKQRTVALIIAFDYVGYPAEERSGCGQLSCSPDALRFASLAKASGAETHVFCDQPHMPENKGHPVKDTVIAQMKQFGKELGPGDTFVFYFAGHGDNVKEKAKADGTTQEADGMDEEMCFVDASGVYTPIRDNEVADILLKAEFKARPYAHMAAVTDKQEAQDLGDGGAFTSALVETVETLVKEGTSLPQASSRRHPAAARSKISLPQVYNHAFKTYSGKFSKQDFRLETTPDLDPDTFGWPLIPPKGWSVQTLLDPQVDKYLKEKLAKPAVCSP
eukprot:CAMPEP_0115159808 /NCGR_PEP_ID=MMETSP0227-20121206/70447_1 /TAXON_ID=89957 /ORGANISM="Polarella glacialis, Strain CCMP 1383" /LENGTH=308 /DNA_ID=CAMNT_0002571619 /DNA_START=58 /DNA_END=981 /DNA_ORIENTATION=+